MPDPLEPRTSTIRPGSSATSTSRSTQGPPQRYRLPAPRRPTTASSTMGRGCQRWKAERAGFEPANELAARYSLSRRVPSASRPPLRERPGQCRAAACRVAHPSHASLVGAHLVALRRASVPRTPRARTRGRFRLGGVALAHDGRGPRRARVGGDRPRPAGGAREHRRRGHGGRRARAALRSRARGARTEPGSSRASTWPSVSARAACTPSSARSRPAWRIASRGSRRRGCCASSCPRRPAAASRS